MTAFYFPDSTIDAFKERMDIYGVQAQSWINKWVSYILHSKTRQAVRLSSWLKPQLQVHSQDLLSLAESLKRPTHDETMQAIIMWVRRNITYVSDNSQVKENELRMLEYWQTAQQTFDLRHGDCEDGAILMYVIARLADVPATRLLLHAGDVHNPYSNQTAGHAWLAYRPTNFPLNWVFMDWCYYYSSKLPVNRNMFYISGTTVHEYKQMGRTLRYEQVTDSNYKSMWFCFNEDNSYLRVNNTFKLQKI
jgi:transglutaminase-like putative cysteine protease